MTIDNHVDPVNKYERMEEEKKGSTLKNMIFAGVAIAVVGGGIYLNSIRSSNNNTSQPMTDSTAQHQETQPVIRDTYLAHKGDNLRKIAKLTHLNSDALKALNPGYDFSHLKPGDTIYTSKPYTPVKQTGKIVL